MGNSPASTKGVLYYGQTDPGAADLAAAQQRYVAERHRFKPPHIEKLYQQGAGGRTGEEHHLCGHPGNG